MMKAIKALFVLLLTILTISGALAAEKKNKPEIKTVDNYVAVFDFEVRDKDKDISRPLADSVIHEFSQSDKYEVIDRGNMNKILKEQKFQMSGCVAQECKVEAGQILGVGKIVNGSVGLVGKTYYLTLQLIDVKTGKVELSAEDKCKCELDELLDSTKRLAKKLLGEKVEQPVTTAPKPATAAESKAEVIAKAKAEEIAKAKTEADELARQKALDAEREQLAAERHKFLAERAKVEAEAAAKAKVRAEEIEREKAAQIAKTKVEAEAIAKAEEIARAKNEANELARQKALDAEREQLAAERRKFLAERAEIEAEAAAKAKARAEEIEREKAAQISKAKAEAITKPAEPEQKIINSFGMTFVYIKPGTFMMGSPSGELGRDNDETQHQVILTKGFYMQTTEVTQGQWQSVMGNNPSHFKNCGDDCPVESVSWDDAQEFIWRLNQKEGGSSYRLPTEAEWEYACRAGTNTRFSFGDSDSQLSDYAWYDGGVFFGKAFPVARKQPNSWGPYDMHGNVKEWCQDWYGIYPKGNVTDPAGPSRGSERVYRGGSWFGYAVDCRSANRDYFTPGFRSYNLGFRLSMIPLSEQVEQSVAIVQKPATVAESKVKQGQIGFEPTTAAIAPPAAPAKETPRDGRFIAYDNGIVLDTRTNLMWAAKDNGSEITWWDAKSYCDNYSGGGYTDWRMPTHNELAGLYDEDKTYQSECRGFFGSTWGIHLTESIRLSCISVWTWETRGSEFAYFSFNTGKRYWNLQSFDINKLSLPVRSGK